MPTLYDYLDFRRYVRDWFAERPMFSYRAFAKRVSFSHALVAAVSSKNKAKQRNITEKLLPEWCAGLRLNKSESDYFCKLVRANQAKTPDARRRAWADLVANRHFARAHHLTADQYSLLSTWYNLAILELTRLEGFQSDPRWIAQQLRPKITVPQVKRALALLERIGLIEWKKGRCLPTRQAIIDAPESGEARQAALDQLYTWALQRSGRAISEYQEHERHFIQLTLQVERDRYPEIVEELRQVLKRIQQTCDEGESGQRVYQLGVQLFPLSGWTDDDK